MGIADGGVDVVCVGMRQDAFQSVDFARKL